jgi:hypothetical protein
VSDRIKALTVILERDNRDDDTQALADAIKMFVGVADVKMQVVTSEDHLARVKVRREITDKLWKALESDQ